MIATELKRCFETIEVGTTVFFDKIWTKEGLFRHNQKRGVRDRGDRGRRDIERRDRESDKR